MRTMLRVIAASLLTFAASCQSSEPVDPRLDRHDPSCVEVPFVGGAGWRWEPGESFGYWSDRSGDFIGFALEEGARIFPTTNCLFTEPPYAGD